MKIITCNLPESYLRIIDSLVGQEKLYLSRSELIRVAIREFLIRELEPAQNFLQNSPILEEKPLEEKPPEPIDESLIVRIPIGSPQESPRVQYKNYKIVQKSDRPRI